MIVWSNLGEYNSAGALEESSKPALRSYTQRSSSVPSCSLARASPGTITLSLYLRDGMHTLPRIALTTSRSSLTRRVGLAEAPILGRIPHELADVVGRFKKRTSGVWSMLDHETVHTSGRFFLWEQDHGRGSCVAAGVWTACGISKGPQHCGNQERSQ